jgi:hypothetical protein
VAKKSPVDRAVDDAREWATKLGPSWVAKFDQMHAGVRRWAEEVGIDPLSYEFRASWCVATTFLHRMAEIMDEDDHDAAEGMERMTNILATVGLWGIVANEAPSRR